MDLKIIQTFDLLGKGGGEHLKNLYRWLHATMEIEAKRMTPTEWRSYAKWHDMPCLSDHDCGL